MMPFPCGSARPPRRLFLCIPVLAVSLIGTAPAAAEDMMVAQLPSDLTQLSLTDLMTIEVTSVSKRAEPVAQAAAAIFVLTGDDIRRSGVRSMAEALRLVPGLHVARTNLAVQQYAISARGFNSGTTDKLEVLLDGRSVYSPLFSGVFWDTLDTYLPDIDRIEVIRGPGAALWGANAVNGVINIITKPAGQTQGTQVTAGGGDNERMFGAARTGSRMGDAGHVRLYAQSLERDDGKRPDGTDSPTLMRLRQAGFRADLHGAPASRYTIEGDVYSGSRDGDFGTLALNGSNILGRWTYQLSERSDLSFKSYFDRYHRFIPQVYEEHRDTADLDVQHHLRIGERQDFLYGLSYRNTRDNTGGPPLVYEFTPAARTLQTYSAFGQDQISLGAATLTVGSKFEHNDYSGFELQPSVRLGWTPHEQIFTWGAVSRAVRSPNRLDRDIKIFFSGFTFLPGNPNFDSEKLIAYEWGLRWWTEQAFSADLAVYYNDYTQLKSTEATPPPFGTYDNKLQGVGRGAELNLNWHLRQALDLRTWYAYSSLHLHASPGSTDTGTALAIEGANPRHNGGIDLKWQPAERWTFDATLRHVSALATGKIPGYTDLNLRAAYRVRGNLEFSLAGSNLLHRQHAEFGLDNAARLEAQRGVFAQIDWTWE